MKKIYINVCKLSVIIACICLTVFVGYSFTFDGKEEIIIPFPLAVILVIATFFAAACLLSASVIEVYHRIQRGKSGAVKALLIEMALIIGICFAISRKAESIITAVGVVVGSWGVNYIFRKRDVSDYKGRGIK